MRLGRGVGDGGWGSASVALLVQGEAGYFPDPVEVRMVVGADVSVQVEQDRCDGVLGAAGYRATAYSWSAAAPGSVVVVSLVTLLTYQEDRWRWGLFWALL